MVLQREVRRAVELPRAERVDLADLFDPPAHDLDQLAACSAGGVLVEVRVDEGVQGRASCRVLCLLM